MLSLKENPERLAMEVLFQSRADAFDTRQLNEDRYKRSERRERDIIMVIVPKNINQGGAF